MMIIVRRRPKLPRSHDAMADRSRKSRGFGERDIHQNKARVRRTENLPAFPATDAYPFDKRVPGQFIEFLARIKLTPSR